MARIMEKSRNDNNNTKNSRTNAINNYSIELNMLD